LSISSAYWSGDHLCRRREPVTPVPGRCLLCAAAAGADLLRPGRRADRILKALADPTRLRLVSLVAAHDGGETCVCDLTKPLGLTQPAIPRHLKILVDAGIFTRDKRGVRAYYALVPEALNAPPAVLRTS
jgi:ArsR family transcriptional regulator